MPVVRERRRIPLSSARAGTAAAIRKPSLRDLASRVAPRLDSGGASQVVLRATRRSWPRRPPGIETGRCQSADRLMQSRAGARADDELRSVARSPRHGSLGTSRRRSPPSPRAAPWRRGFSVSISASWRATSNRTATLSTELRREGTVPWLHPRRAASARLSRRGTSTTRFRTLFVRGPVPYAGRSCACMPPTSARRLSCSSRRGQPSRWARRPWIAASTVLCRRARARRSGRAPRSTPRSQPPLSGSEEPASACFRSGRSIIRPPATMIRG